MFDVAEELKKLPHKPGVYIMHDDADAVIYVGKAIDLNNRVHSYFRTNINRGPKIQKMVTLIAYFEYIVTDSELEALVLENNLIKEYAPKYNTMLTDDKTYPYIKVTVEEAYPRILFARTMKKDRARYFGPFTSAAAVKDTIELLNSLFKLRTCNRNLPRDCGKERPCLNYQMHRCLGACRGNVTKEEYDEQIRGALDFLSGRYKEILSDLERKMTEAGERLDFEEAIRYRELLKNVQSVAQRQKITDSSFEDRDIIAVATQGNDSVVQVFFVRNGRLIGREHFHMNGTEGEEPASLIGSFMKQYYQGTPFVPREIMVQALPEDAALIADWLSNRRESKVSILAPKIGQKEKLVELAATNAALVLQKDLDKIRYEEERTRGAVAEIEAITGLKNLHRMEAFDISNTSGFQNVASMVVFEDGKPKRSDYRKFKIRSVSGPNDYACMEEVLTRRLSDSMDKEGFAKLPDVILMDGGRGQVNIALEVMDRLGIHVPVCGMVKDDNHHTRGLYYQNIELPIDRHSEGFKLITRIQDEAHRFAITFHRSLRAKAQVHSVLDDLPGVGPARKRALMKHFTSIEELRTASVEKIAAVSEIPSHVARQIYDFFHPAEKTTENEQENTAASTD